MKALYSFFEGDERGRIQFADFIAARELIIKKVERPARRFCEMPKGPLQLMLPLSRHEDANDFKKDLARKT